MAPQNAVGLFTVASKPAEVEEIDKSLGPPCHPQPQTSRGSASSQHLPLSVCPWPGPASYTSHGPPVCTAQQGTLGLGCTCREGSTPRVEAGVSLRAMSPSLPLAGHCPLTGALGTLTFQISHYY